MNENTRHTILSLSELNEKKMRCDPSCKSRDVKILICKNLAYLLLLIRFLSVFREVWKRKAPRVRETVRAQQMPVDYCITNTFDVLPWQWNVGNINGFKKINKDPEKYCVYILFSSPQNDHYHKWRHLPSCGKTKRRPRPEPYMNECFSFLHLLLFCVL